MFIRTYNGKKFNFTAEDYFNLTLEECVHATPHVARWCGQVKSPVSLSRHSTLVGYLSESIALRKGGTSLRGFAARAAGLCHDFIETTTNDIPAPLKQNLTIFGLPYKEWEEEMIVHLTRGILSRSSMWKGNEDLVISCLTDGTVSLADRMALTYESIEFHPLWGEEDHIQMPADAPSDIALPVVNLFLREPEYMSVRGFQDDVRQFLG